MSTLGSSVPLGMAILVLLLPPFVARGAEAPEIECTGSEVALYGDSTPIVFVAKGGSADPPPSEYANGTWTRTGNKIYQWRIIHSASRDEPVPIHPLDGVLTTTNTLALLPRVAGSFDVKVSIHEEWKDSANPLSVIYWPTLPVRVLGGPARTDPESERPVD